MSPTFIRLKHFVLASLVAAAAVHQSLPFAEAAPTPTPLSNELLLPSLAPRSVNSDVFGVPIPVGSTEMDSDFDCGLDQFAINPRCVAAQTLIRRTNAAGTLEKIDAPQQYDAALDQEMEEICTQVDHLFEMGNPPNGSNRDTDTTRQVFLIYYKHICSPKFQDQMSRISPARMTNILHSFQIMKAVDHKPYNPELAKVVYHYLTMNDLDTICRPTMQAFLIAQEILGLKKAEGDIGLKKAEGDIAKEYLPKFRDLLKSRVYKNDPSVRLDHIYTDLGTTTEVKIGEVSSRYMGWKTKKGETLEALKQFYTQQLRESGKEETAVKVVLNAYKWLLSQPDDSEPKHLAP